MSLLYSIRFYLVAIKTRRPASADRIARREFQAGLRGDVQDFNWWLLGKPVFDCMFAVIKMWYKISPAGSLD